MKRRQTWWAVGLALAALWITVAAVIWYVRGQRPTAEKTIAYVSDQTLPSRSPDARAAVITEVARQLNRLPFEERKQAQFNRQMERFCREMTEAERAQYLALTLTPGLRQFVAAFNQMSPTERRRHLELAMRELDEQRPRSAATPSDLSEDEFRRIVDEGLASYLRDASASAKIDLQPLIEQLQNILQLAR